MTRTTRLLCLLCLLTACGSPTEAPSDGTAGEITIAVIPKGTTHEFWKSVHAGAVKPSAS